MFFSPHQKITMEQISDLLAEIHFKIRMAEMKITEQSNKPKQPSFSLSGFFKEKDSTQNDLYYLNLCRDYLRNENLENKNLETIFANAPYEIKKIYTQIQTFTDQEKDFCKELFNEQGSFKSAEFK